MIYQAKSNPQRVRRQPQRRSIFAHTHSAPVHRLDVHRTERLQGAIACVRADPKALPPCLSQAFLPLFTALLSAQFRLIFRELVCSFLACEGVEPAHERPFVQPMLTAICLARNAATPPGLDVNRPPFTPGFVPEMFWTHRRFSTAAENPKWNESTSSKSRARTGRLHARFGRQGKRPAGGPGLCGWLRWGIDHTDHAPCWRSPRFLNRNQSSKRHRPAARPVWRYDDATG